MPSIDQITPIIEAKVNAMGFELFDIKFANAGARSLLRISIDKPGGLSVDDCENVSHTISTILDLENFSTLPYSLEVSSPGLDRPLIREKDFKRVVGQNVVLVLKAESTLLQKTLSGILNSVENGVLLVQCDKETISVPLADIANGKVVITF